MSNAPKDERDTSEARFGRIISPTTGCLVMVEPPDAVDGLLPKMLVTARGPSGVRAGCAEVQSVSVERGEIEFLAPLNSQIVAATQGDLLIEYEIPCRRCECKRCVAERGMRSEPPQNIHGTQGVVTDATGPRDIDRRSAVSAGADPSGAGCEASRLPSSHESAVPNSGPASLNYEMACDYCRALAGPRNCSCPRSTQDGSVDPVHVVHHVTCPVHEGTIAKVIDDFLREADLAFSTWLCKDHGGEEAERIMFILREIGRDLASPTPAKKDPEQ